MALQLVRPTQALKAERDGHPTMAQKPDPIIERASLFEAAVQYYISGRWAVFNRLYEVAGNLLHHAVEMEIKAALSAGEAIALPS